MRRARPLGHRVRGFRRISFHFTKKRRRGRRTRRFDLLWPLDFLFRNIPMVVFSPFGLIWEIFRGRPRVGRGWVSYYMIFCFALLCSWIGASSYVVKGERQAVAALGHFSQSKSEAYNCPFAAEINYYALRADIDPSLVAAVISQESSFNANAVSPAGARGLMQIMPAVFRELNPDSPCSGDHAPPACGEQCIFDPATNIKTGVKLLHSLVEEFHGDIIMALAAYNAGGRAVKRYQGEAASEGLPPYKETQQYVRRIALFWPEFRSRNVHARLWIISILTKVITISAWANLGAWGLLFVWIILRTKGR